MNRDRQDFILSIIGVFAFFVAISSAYFTFLQIGIIPVLAFSLKAFLLGSCIGTIALYNRGRKFILDLDTSFIFGFGFVATSSLLVFASLLAVTTLFMFLVGFLFFYSGAVSFSDNPEEEDASGIFVFIFGILAIVVFVFAITEPALAPIYGSVLSWFSQNLLLVISIVVIVAFFIIALWLIIKYT